jgi:vancomycin permeability regulator SanA
MPALTILVEGIADNPHSADVGVVLGNKVEPDGQPSPMLKARLDQTVKLYRLNYFPRIIVSGGVGREGYNEPSAMRHYLEAAGVPSSAIDEDAGGINTWQTARNTAHYLKEHHLGSVLVISQYFHLPRCRLAFAKFGIGPVYTSHAPYWSIRDFYSLTREIAGWVVYDLRRPDPIDAATAPE